MKFNISEDELSGDLSAKKLYLVKYYDQFEPENSPHSLTVANDEKHLKELERAKLKEQFEKKQWFSAESESAEPGEFEEQFENDWGNWIKYYEIATAG